MSINPRLKLFRIGTFSQQQQEQPQSQQNFNNDLQKLKTKKSRLSNKGSNKFEATSSILSDYDDLEIIDGEDDDQSSYVLFNPKLSSKTKNESDILSLTNTSKEDEVEEGRVNEEEEEEDEDTEQEDNDLEEELEEENHLKRKIESNSYNKLSNKINSWHHSNLYSSTQQIDENIASWNLDYDEIETTQKEIASIETESNYYQNLQQSQQSQKLSNSNQSLEESKKLLKEFYGDDLFKYLKDDDILEVKNYLKKLNIKESLNKNQDDQLKNQTLLQQIIYKLIYLNQPDMENKNISNDSKLLMGSTDYINYLTKDIQSQYHNLHQYHSNYFVEPTNTFSEISGGGGSSIVCGGASWNEL
ncbi:hypothetical protein KGF54_002811 [Candida jiufengensis]|uniref:uncharacterized protein n=1 Tax=Candida jiufengensis TaxID=497108 RepID=UPI002225B6CD|nr:uncharacterized protein KGF54_002811 [Candida jiufengensis]KAI5953439.1 hypothetical protein KGF54_002811 [Candida jiufengensis]